jgi:hypothetical protein
MQLYIALHHLYYIKPTQFQAMQRSSNASLKGIQKAGFEYAGKLYFDEGDKATIEYNETTITLQEELEYMDITLSEQTASSLVKPEISKNEVYSSNEVPLMHLTVSIGYAGCQTYYSATFVYRGELVTIPTINLSNSTASLKTETISAGKKMVDVKADKTILKVEFLSTWL